MQTKRCKKCGQEKPLTSFKRSMDKRRKTSRRVADHRRRNPDGRRSVCNACRKTVTRRNKGAKPRAEITAAAAEGRKKRSLDSRDKALRSFLNSLYSLRRQRCEDQGLSLGTVKYQHRYRTDPVFREREIARTWQRKSASGVLRTDARSSRTVEDDGTLDSATVRRLFADATWCPYCGERMLPRDKTLDHMQPVSRGGKHSITNVVVCCRSCNSRKHTMPLMQWLRVATESTLALQ